MCIAILNTKGVISKNKLKTCFSNNPDGAGYAFTDGTNVQIFKELKHFGTFYSNYKAHRKQYPGSNFLIHFRIRTHGAVNLSNCHPFRVNDDLAFIHNGMIDITTQGEYSDTYAFNEHILKGLPANFMDNPGILQLLESFIGYSKVVFLNKSDEYVILNEKMGHWFEDNWYSNYSYTSCGSGYYGSGKSTYSGGTTSKQSSINYEQDTYGHDNYWEDYYGSENKSIIDNKDVQKAFEDYDKNNFDPITGECELCYDTHGVKFVPDENMEICSRCRQMIFTGQDGYFA